VAWTERHRSSVGGLLSVRAELPEGADERLRTALWPHTKDATNRAKGSMSFGPAFAWPYPYVLVTGYPV